MLLGQEGIKQPLDHGLVFFRQVLHFLKLPRQLPVFKVGLGRFLGRTVQQVVAADVQGVGQALQCIVAGPGGPALAAVNMGVMQSGQFAQLGLRQVFCLRSERRRSAKPFEISAIPSASVSFLAVDRAMLAYLLGEIHASVIDCARFMLDTIKPFG